MFSRKAVTAELSMPVQLNIIPTLYRHVYVHKYTNTYWHHCVFVVHSMALVKKHEVLWLSWNFHLTHSVISSSVTLRVLTNTAAELHRAGVRKGIWGLDWPNYRCLHHAHMTSLKCHSAKHTHTHTYIFCPHSIRLWCDRGQAHVSPRCFWNRLLLFYQCIVSRTLFWM